MLKTLFFFLFILASSFSWSQTESSVSLLDNRFRVDPEIEQISFVIYRKDPSVPVILVRPDGVKYYFREHPESISWYQEGDIDIISISEPMPGPWQAIGKVTPKNNVKLLSNILLHINDFPSRLYTNEVIKFTAHLTQDGAPLELKDFLDRVKLYTDFIQFVEEEDDSEQTSKPISVTLGTFKDDGLGLDEVANDGSFTVELFVSVPPGKYIARMTSGNGVFLREVEKEVLVYPSPISVKFVQERSEDKDHTMMVVGEAGTLLPGSLAVSIEQTSPDQKSTTTQSSVEENSLATHFPIPNNPSLGIHKWKGNVYATEAATKRELVLQIEESSFNVTKGVDLDKSEQAYKRAQEEKRKALELQKIKKKRDEIRKTAILRILVGNLMIISLGFIVWFVIRKIRMRKMATSDIQLDEQQD